MELDKMMIAIEKEDWLTLKKIRNSINRMNPKARPMTLSEVCHICIDYYWREDNRVLQGRIVEK